MDRGDTGFIMHESFKDLKTRRAEQEAYRKALEAQIMEKKRLQEQEREREMREYGGGRNSKYPMEPWGTSQIQKVQPPSSHRGKQQSGKSAHNPNPEVDLNAVPSSLPSHALPPLPESLNAENLHNQNQPVSHNVPPPVPDSKGSSRVRNINEIDSFNEPHPAAIGSISAESIGSPPEKPISGPEIPPEFMKYIQQVLPGFTLPTTAVQAQEPGEIPSGKVVDTSAAGSVNVKGRDQNQTNSTSPPRSGRKNNTSNVNSGCQAFSCGSSSESSSAEDILKNIAMRGNIQKLHVSQTSEELSAGVKVSRTLYKADLQKQIEERRKREEELKRKEQEEEERIQEKIRIEQERMQREYEEDLRKQQEKERETEKRRLAALKKQNEIKGSDGKGKSGKKKARPRKGKAPTELIPDETEESRGDDSIEDSNNDGQTYIAANASSSAETIESIGEFFDSTELPLEHSPYLPRPAHHHHHHHLKQHQRQTKYIDPDDRIIPTVARMLKEKVRRGPPEQSVNSDEEEDYEKKLTTTTTTTVPAPESETGSRNNNNDNKKDIVVGLTARIENNYSRSREDTTTSTNNDDDDEHSFYFDSTTMPPPPEMMMMTREMAIRSAPCPPTNLTGLEFLRSLKNYLELEKSKINQRIQARGSRSTEKF